MSHLLQWFIATDRGRVREANEDSVMAYPIAEDLARQPNLVPVGGRLCVVADGMGGHRGGREASTMAVRRIAMVYYNQQGQRPGDALAAAIQQTSREILLQGQSDPALERMGTTVVLATDEGEIAHIANVGDSRAYHWSAGRLQMISVDDRWVAAQVRERVLTEEQARNHMYRNVLTQNLGSAEPVVPHLAEVALQPGDVLLLCTDGLFELVSDEEIGHTLGTAPPERVPQLLVNLALRRGAPDNVTVAVGAYGPPQPRPHYSPVWLIAVASLAVLLTIAISAVLGISMWRQGTSSVAISAHPGIITATVSSTATRPTSTTIPVTTTPVLIPEPTAVPTIETFTPTVNVFSTVVAPSPIMLGGPRIEISDPLISPDGLTVEEKSVYEDCIKKISENPQSAGIIVARSEHSSATDPISFTFTTALEEPQSILPNNKVRKNSDSVCFIIIENEGKVFVSGDGLQTSIDYSFKARQIYLVKYYPSGSGN